MRVDWTFCGRWTLSAALLAMAATVHASGRIELNQTVVQAAGGFPYTISAPGNFVLTGHLTVPANTDALVLTTSEVVIDLNGFSISGPHTCVSGNCIQGTGMAIRGQSGIAHAHRTTLRNGVIRGFANNCVQLGAHARVDELLVTACGRFGISVANGSLVTNNRVVATGGDGLVLSGAAHPPLFAHNTIADAGLSGGTAVSGHGKPSAGNSCDDRTCTGDGRRLFYLTNTLAFGADADGACAPGFHMASLFEMYEVSSLAYDTTRGLLRADSGEGPPSLYGGWVRTGFDSDSVGGIGLANCSNWSSSSSAEHGSMVQLLGLWQDESELPWDAGREPCDTLNPVWCVQN